MTGANGGIGTHFVHDALARGARKVYATARHPAPGTTSASSRSHTQMAAHANDSKTDPADLVRSVFDGLEAGETSRQLKAALSAPIEAMYPQLKTAND